MRHISLASTCACILFLTACGAGGAEEDASNGEPIPLTVSATPVANALTIWLAQAKGIYEKHGLDVEIVSGQGGATIIPSLVAGDLDVGCGNVVSVLTASEQGLPLQFIAPQGISAGESGADWTAIVVPSGSDITSAADLSGATVSVNTLKNIDEVLVRSAADGAGVDPSAVNLVEVPFANAPAVLASGDVDAAFIAEPFLSVALSEGAKVISSPAAELSPNLMLSGCFATVPYIHENSEAVDAFAAAQDEALSYAAEHPDEAREFLSTFTEIDPSLQAEVTMPGFQPGITNQAENVQLLADLLFENGFIESEVDASDVIYSR